MPKARTLSTASNRALAVWGDPIAHSRSPRLHAAAYRVLGIPWTYERRRVAEAAFGRELSGLSDRWRGLSLTMPLKGVAYAAARTRDRHAQLTGAVNTLLLTADGPHGFNSDVGGLVRDLTAWGMAGVDAARIVGAGATAKSALVALAELGARSVEVVARRPQAVASLQRLGGQLAVEVSATPMSEAAFASVPLTIAALPGTATVPDSVAGALAAAGGMLYDVVYGHWPTVLASAWHPDEPVIDGSGMLLHQALLQVRIFATGDVDRPLPGEESVIAAMRDALVGD